MSRSSKRSKQGKKGKPVTAFLQKLCRIVNTSAPVCKWNSAGDTIAIQTSSGLVQVQVPAGVTAGQQFDVQVVAPAMPVAVTAVAMPA